MASSAQGPGECDAVAASPLLDGTPARGGRRYIQGIQAERNCRCRLQGATSVALWSIRNRKRYFPPDCHGCRAFLDATGTSPVKGNREKQTPRTCKGLPDSPAARRLDKSDRTFRGIRSLGQQQGSQSRLAEQDKKSRCNSIIPVPELLYRRPVLGGPWPPRKTVVFFALYTDIRTCLQGAKSEASARAGDRDDRETKESAPATSPSWLD